MTPSAAIMATVVKSWTRSSRAEKDAQEPISSLELTGALPALTPFVTTIEDSICPMSRILRLRTLFAVAVVTAPPVVFVEWHVRRLERAYPPLSPEMSSTAAFRTPQGTKVHTPHVDVYGARVPLSGLLAKTDSDDQLAGASLEELWARTFFSTKTMRREAQFAGRGAVAAGQLGEEGFKPGASILSGVMRVLRAPGEGVPLLVEWRMPDHLPRFFEGIARWGYPWRLMNGGRHEWSVGNELNEDGEIEVRFGSAHDYNIVEGEGGGGKVIPLWVQKLHRAYARYLLDQAVKKVRSLAADKVSLPSDV